MRFVKLMISPFENASRNKRELSVVSKMGAEIIIVAKGDENEICEKEGYTVHERTTRPLGNSGLITRVNRVVSIYTWARYLRSLKADYISCHGLGALLIGALSNRFRKNAKTQLIYDSHEFEIDVATAELNGEFKKKVIARIEKFLINRSCYTIVVSDSIASELQRVHSLKEKPVVIRNIPPYWSIDSEICKLMRNDIMQKLGINQGKAFITMYHGALFPGRGIEYIIKAIGLTKDIYLIVLGYGSNDYIDQLKDLCEKEKVLNRTLFIPAVPFEEMWKYIGAVDAGMITIPNTAQSYYYMLPNKLFENIQSLTPIICSNFPEITKVINSYGIGLTADPVDIYDIKKAMETMRDDKELYMQFKNNLNQAKEELCWEKESNILEKLYSRLFKLGEYKPRN